MGTIIGVLVGFAAGMLLAMRRQGSNRLTAEGDYLLAALLALAGLAVGAFISYALL